MRLTGAWGAVLLTGLVMMSPVYARTDGTVVTIAVADFDFIDSSGEAKDQQAAHDARLAGLSQGLRADLGAAARYRVVPLACALPDCRDGDPAALADGARRAGARLLLLGAVHKTSTLLLSTKLQLLDLQANKLVFDRFLSFRGDNDEAWRRMEHFIARDLAQAVDDLPADDRRR
ncbi:MAG: DUF2380 domain-containing protein [Azospirillaceae bacterium]|nr:DUF2380 domain-containing protein [Azospirillaceae bacterium]